MWELEREGLEGDVIVGPVGEWVWLYHGVVRVTCACIQELVSAVLVDAEALFR